MNNPPPVLAYLRPAALPATEIWVASGSTANWRLFHERYLICGCNSVASTWLYRGKSRFMEDGCTAFVEPGETHQVMAKHKPSHFHALFIDAEYFVHLAAECGFSGVPHFRVAQLADPELSAMLGRFTASVQGEGTPLEQQSRLVALAHHSLRHAERKLAELKSTGHHRPLQRARDLLHQRFHESITLDDLAAAAAVSRFHLVRSFTKQYGLPPHSYQIHLRVERARALLREGVSPLTAATSVGFADQSHFARHFKKIMQTTPASYARAVQLRRAVVLQFPEQP